MPLEEYSLEEVRHWSGSHVFSSTTKFFEGELSTAEYRAFRRSLGTGPFGVETGRTCLVFGHGGQPRHVYDILSTHNDIEVLWNGLFLPLLLWPLSLVVSCQGGLLRANRSEAARVALHLLSYRGMVEVLSFSSNVADRVAQHVRRRRWRARPGEIVGNDPTYFLFGVERDHPSAGAGIIGWCSFGPDCPLELQRIAASFVAGEPHKLEESGDGIPSRNIPGV